MASFPNSICRDYHSYAAITIQATYIDSTVTELPVKITDACLPDEFLDKDGSYSPRSDGRDVRFFKDDNAGGTPDLDEPLEFDIIHFYLDNTPANSEIEINVRVGSLSASTNTVIYVAWGQPKEIAFAAADTYGSENAYYPNWEGVWPGTSDTTSLWERTDHGLTGTKKATTEPVANDNSTYPYNSQDFDGSNDYITLSDIDNGSTQTICFMIKLDGGSASGFERIFSKKNAYNDSDGWEINRISGTTDQIEVIGKTTSKSNFTLTNLDDTNWHCLAVRYDGTTVTVFMDGVDKGTGSSSITAITDNNLAITLGDDVDKSESNFDGELSNIMINSDAIASDYLEAFTKSYSDPGTFAVKGTRTEITDPQTAAVIDHIERDSFSFTSSQGVKTLGTTITNLDQTILFASARNDQSSGWDFLNAISFLNTTTIHANREGNTGTVNVEYQAIEFSAGVKVEHKRQQVMTGTELEITLTNNFNRDRSFIIITYELARSNLGSPNRISVEFKHNNLITLNRQSSSGTAYVDVQVVQYDYSNVYWLNYADNGTVFTRDLDLEDDDSVKTGDTPTVDTSKTFLIGSNRNQLSNDYSGVDLYSMEVLDSNTVRLTRKDNTSPLTYLRIFVIEFTDTSKVYQYTGNETSTHSTISVTLSPTVTPASAIALTQALDEGGYLLSNSENNVPEDGGDIAYTCDLTSSSNVDLIRADSSASDTYYSLAVIDFLVVEVDGRDHAIGAGVARGIIRGT